MRMPRRAAAVSALTTVTGVEITSAQGQAMTSSASASYAACCQFQPMKSGAATASSNASTKTMGV